jgi:DNA-binding SARP family transcriptional activator
VGRAPAVAGKSRQLLLLGGFELRWAGGPVRVQRSGQRLLALLALQERPLERLWVAGTLWMDASEERAGASLRSALWRLPQPGGTPMVESSVTHLRLARDIDVDLHDLSARIERLEQASTAIDDRTGSSALTRDLLPDWYEDWVVLERERFRQLRLHALEALCARLTEAGRFGAAVQAGLAAARERPPHPHPGPPGRGQPGRGGPPVPPVPAPARRRAGRGAVGRHPGAGPAATAVTRR